MLNSCFYRQKPAYGVRISDWSSDGCSSDLMLPAPPRSSIYVSVIVAACNAQEYLGDAVRSALAPADGGVEILIVDDASTDRTRQIAEYHAGRDPRIRVIRSERDRKSTRLNSSH